MIHSLRGKRVLISGAAGGIGQATVRELQAQGAAVAGVDLRAADGIFGATCGMPGRYAQR